MSINVSKCIKMLKDANNDNEKLAALFMVTKVVDDRDCDTASRKALFEAIGIDFFNKLLFATNAVEDCPQDTFKSLGLTILIAFCHDPEIIDHPHFIVHLPHVLKILEVAIIHSDSSEADLAFNLLEMSVCRDKALKSLISAMAVPTLSRIATNHKYRRIEILKMLLLLMMHDKTKMKDDENDITKVLNALSLLFLKDHGSEKFEIIEAICSFLSLYNSAVEGPSISDHPWPQNLFDGLKDILRSTVDKPRRDQALKLGAMAVNVFGPNWLISDKKEPKKFFLMYVHLCSIEVRLAMEDRSVIEVLDNAELITSCFVVIESAVYFMAADNIELEQNDILNVYRVLKHTFCNILAVLEKVSQSIIIENCTERERAFLYALVKVSISWLTQETNYTNAEIWNVLPFMLKFINEAFVIHCTKTDGACFKNDRPDLLRLVLPVLSQLASDDKGRELILSSGQLDTLYNALCYYWNRYYESATTLQFESIEIRDMKVALFYLCDVYINIITVESYEKLKYVFPGIDSLLSFILNIDYTIYVDMLESVRGCLAVLGLVILRQLPDINDSSEICHCIKYAFNFIYLLHDVDEVHSTMRIAERFLNDWPDILEFWSVGFETLVSLISANHWIADLAIEDSWPEKLISTLRKISPCHLQPEVKSKYEGLLCILSQENENVKSVIKEANVLKLFKKHKFSTLLPIIT